MTSAAAIVLVSFSCLGKERIGRFVERACSGVRGMLFLLGSGERERCVLRMRAVVLCSLVGGQLGELVGRWEGGRRRMVGREWRGAQLTLLSS